MKKECGATQGKYTVDLGQTPRLPFGGAEVVKHEGQGFVEIELRPDDNLYIDGKKVVLNLSERQMNNNRVVAHELRMELAGGKQGLLNCNVMDCLLRYPELFPKHWKKDENGENRHIFFWGSIFQAARNTLFVRYLYWSAAGLVGRYLWLDIECNRQDWSASVIV